MRGRWPVTLMLLAILVASCTNRPGIDVTIDGANVATTYVSDTQRSACSATISDGFPATFQLTTVRTDAPVTLHVRSAGFVSEISGWIYEDADGRPLGTPIEEFAIRGSEGDFVSRAMRPGSTYNVLVNAAWGLGIAGGEESRAFRLSIESR